MILTTDQRRTSHNFGKFQMAMTLQRFIGSTCACTSTILFPREHCASLFTYDCVLSSVSVPSHMLDPPHGTRFQRTYVPTRIAKFLGNNSNLFFTLAFNVR